MKRWIKRGISALTLGALLTANVLAAEITLSFNQQGTAAAVGLLDAGTDRYAAEVTFSLSNPQPVQYQGKGDAYAVTVDSAAGTVTLYAASSTPLPVTGGALDLGTVTVAAGTEITGSGTAVVLDRSLNRYTYADAAVTVTRDTSSGGSSSGGTSSADRTPAVSVDGGGGKVKASSDGTVTITPDEGYRIARILVNGKEVAAAARLTGLKASDVVVVTFEKEETAQDLPFTDVAPGMWYTEAIRFAVSQNLFQGVSETEFRPDGTMSRAMLVTVLYRMSGEEAAGDSGFADVQPGDWYAAPVAWAKENGIVQGVTDTTFAPNGPVTREQMAAILYRYAQRAGTAGESGGDLSGFTDAASVSPYAAPAMGWAVAEGLLSGVGNQALAPGGFATRAQVAVILQRFLERA